MKTKIKQPKSEVEKFNKWMKEKVKSIYYYDNEKMCNAYNRIIQ